MKKLSVIFFSLLLVVSLSNTTYSKKNSEKGFNKIKTLAGTWHSKMTDGSIAKITYKIVSNGSVIMETISGKEDDAMVTMYHVNGDNLMMTHYCSAGNQPRMKAEVNDNEIKTLNFKYIDATNLKSGQDGHMINLVLTFKDKDHFSQAWTWTKDGKSVIHIFEAERVK
ncbi:MAG: hypothetical protein IIC75_03190 [Bacteroidetes bacterium]|nr:hypothetical protein [Bacteroidota bacterium]